MVLFLIDRHVPHYNVPGEKALASDAWVRAYQASVREHLAHLREQQPAEGSTPRVLRAGKSKKGSLRYAVVGGVRVGARRPASGAVSQWRCTGLGST